METLPERIEACRKLTDAKLAVSLAGAVAREREELISVLIHIGEFDARDLARDYGFANLFEYCIRTFRYSRSGAGRRIQAARAGRKFPIVLEMIGMGDLTLVGAAMLNEHLTEQNHAQVLASANRRNEEQVAAIVASLAPGKRKREVIRIVSAPSNSGPSQPSIPPQPPPEAGNALVLSVEAAPAAPEPRAELRRIAFDISADTYDLVRRAKEILRHRFPQGDMDDILRLALERLLDQEDRDRRSRPSKPWLKAAVAGGRHIPEAIKQAVWDRDGGRCAYEGQDGRRCGSRAWLEFDHIRPVALGGLSTVDNLRLLCRGHNARAGRLVFGGPQPAALRRVDAREPGRPQSGPRGPPG